jgi:hypothetical protein
LQRKVERNLIIYYIKRIMAGGTLNSEESTKFSSILNDPFSCIEQRDKISKPTNALKCM